MEGLGGSEYVCLTSTPVISITLGNRSIIDWISLGRNGLYRRLKKHRSAIKFI